MITTDHLINSREDLNLVLEAVTNFANQHWPAIKVFLDSQSTRGFSGTIDDALMVNVATFGDRTMITIMPTGQQELFVSVAADQASNLKIYPTGRMGLQSCRAKSLQQILEWLSIAQFPELTPIS